MFARVVAMAARIAAAGLVLAFVFATSASALDAFWHGILSKDWNEERGLPTSSNWFDKAPPNGDPTGIPNGVAKFAPGAQNKTVLVRKKNTAIESMFFLAGVEKYTFSITKPLIVTGLIANRADTTPSFIVKGEGNLIFGRNAKITGASPGPLAGNGAIPRAATQSIMITTVNLGKTSFIDSSRGGDAAVRNAGSVSFRNRASAQNMTITTTSEGLTVFDGMSSGGNATLINQKDGALFLHKTTGPKGNGVVTAGHVDNAGEMRIGANMLLLGNFRQRSQGALRMDIRADRAGRIRCATAILAGDLIVDRVSGFQKQYLLMSCNARQGMFKAVHFLSFGLLKPRIVYQGSKILLKLD